MGDTQNKVHKQRGAALRKELRTSMTWLGSNTAKSTCCTPTTKHKGGFQTHDTHICFHSGR